MAGFSKQFQVTARDFMHAGEASVQIKSALKSIGYSPDVVRRAAICAYESEMNIVMHGGGGTLTLHADDQSVVVEAHDNGEGIPDLELAFQEGYSTASDEHREMGFGAGMGLPNIRRNADELKIKTAKGSGTHLTMFFRAASTDENS